mmetsp:Transcript_39297/g.87442  ORF Transcript_39297/g.87442 Transcript_39297/m.87442 type:complete len:256 (-) Transcript_39297:471-1238(-)
MEFQPVQLPKCFFQEPYTKSQLQKWDMGKNMQFHAVRYTKYYHKMQAQEFVLDMLNDTKVQELIKVLVKGGDWVPLDCRVIKVDVEVVPCSLTRMDLFDKITGAEPPIVRANGDIVKCMDDVIEGFQVSDMLRDLLLNESSENAEAVSEEERREFLWQAFEHICLGGACCQFEDKLEPYLEFAKKIYKEMVSVQKNTSTGKVEVASAVYRINSIETESGAVQLFPTSSRNNFCYVSVDPLRRIARLWYHAVLPFW